MIFNNVSFGMKYIYLISFTIDGTSYTALENMTWREWCDSSYNTVGYVVYQPYNEEVVGIVDEDMALYDNTGYVYPDDTIVAGFNYNYEKN